MNQTQIRHIELTRYFYIEYFTEIRIKTLFLYEIFHWKSLNSSIYILGNTRIGINPSRDVYSYIF